MVLKCARIRFMSRVIEAIIITALMAACDNPLADMVETAQAEALSPRIVVMNGASIVESSASIDIGTIGFNETRDLRLTIRNTGKTILRMCDDSIMVTPSSGTEIGIFSIVERPVSLEVDDSSAVVVSIAGSVAGNKKCELMITTNDVMIPSFRITVNVTVSSLPIPDAPDGLRVDNFSDSPEKFTSILVSWNSIESADLGYTISRDVLQAGNYDTKFEYAPTTNSGTIVFTDTTVIPGATYYYKVQAKNAVGSSSLSESESKIGILPGKPITGFSLSAGTFIQARSSTNTLVASISPSDASVQTIAWHSDSPQTVSVSDGGVITAENFGRATITARSMDNTGILRTCVVDVQPDQPGFMIDGVSVQADSTQTISSIPKMLSMQVEPAMATVRYTLDGTTPTVDSLVFDAAAPVNLAGEGVNLTFNAAAFDANAVSSPVSTLYVQVRRTALPTPLTTNTAVSTFNWGAVDPYMTPAGVASDGRAIFITDSNRKVIWKVDIDTGATSILAGALNTRDFIDGTGGGARFWEPKGITTDGTYLYITDRSAVRRIKISTAEVQTLAGAWNYGYVDGAGSMARFSTYVQGITTNGRYLFIVDYKDVTSSYIRRVDLHSPTFNVDTLVTIPHSCSDIATDGSELYITAFFYDETATSKKRGLIWHCSFDGSSIGTIAGNTSLEPGSVDGTGTGATFNDPWALASDGTNLYVFEHGGLRIRRLTVATKQVTTISGTVMEGWTNGIAVDGNSLYYMSKAGYTAVLRRHD